MTKWGGEQEGAPGMALASRCAWRAGLSAAPDRGNTGTENLKPSILIKLHIDLLLEYNKFHCFRAVSRK